MTPSNASTISARFSTACGFSIFATTGTVRPSSSMIRLTSSKSFADRTNDSAMMSAPSLRAQRRSSWSFSDSAGTETATPGRFRPLLFDTGPATSTRVTTRGPSTAVTRTSTLPSSMRIGSPTRASPGRPLCVVETKLLGADDVLGRDREGVTLLEPVLLVAAEAAQADLRPLEVDEHRDGAARLGGGLAHAVVDGRVLLGAAVAAVDPRHVHPGVDERAELLLRLGRGSDGADDLCSAHISSL